VKTAHRSVDYDVAKVTNDRRQVQRWEEERRSEDRDEIGDDPSGSSVLDALLLYLADGYENGSLAVRAVVFILLVRPQLLAGETNSQIAERIGCAAHQLSVYREILRESVPEISFLTPGRTVSAVGKKWFVSRTQLRRQRRELQQRKLTEKARYLDELTRLKLDEKQTLMLQREIRNRVEARFRTVYGEIVNELQQLAADSERALVLSRAREAVGHSSLDPFEALRAEIFRRRGIAQ
jgi:hypothetical protein